MSKFQDPELYLPVQILGHLHGSSLCSLHNGLCGSPILESQNALVLDLGAVWLRFLIQRQIHSVTDGTRLNLSRFGILTLSKASTFPFSVNENVIPKTKRS